MEQSIDLKLSEQSRAEILRLKSLYPQRKSAILMILHVIYGQYGFVEKKALAEAAALLDWPLIDLEQAASFYTFFPNHKVGKYHIQVCRTLSCHLRGALELTEMLKEKLGIRVGEISSDGLFSLAEVECLGSCGTAPVMQINEDYYENLTRDKVDKILADLRAKGQNG